MKGIGKLDRRDASPQKEAALYWFPILDILDKRNPEDTGHYWLMVLNIRDKRFEVLNSSRNLKERQFM